MRSDRAISGSVKLWRMKPSRERRACARHGHIEAALNGMPQNTAGDYNTRKPARLCYMSWCCTVATWNVAVQAMARPALVCGEISNTHLLRSTHCPRKKVDEMKKISEAHMAEVMLLL